MASSSAPSRTRNSGTGQCAEEESEEGPDYYIEGGTIDMLEDDGAPESLVKLLRDALGTRDGVEIAWTRA